MNLSEFLAKTKFKPYASVLNSWDAFGPTGSVLLQLWTAPKQRIKDHAVPGTYLRVCCWNSEHHAAQGKRLVVGYNGRAKAIQAIESGKPGYAALSNAPLEKQADHASGLWAKHADLSKVYPVLQFERPTGIEDIYVLLGIPVPVGSIR